MPRSPNLSLGLPVSCVQVNDYGQVASFEQDAYERIWSAADVDTTLVLVREGMSVGEVRRFVKKTTRKSEMPHWLPKPTAMSVRPAQEPY